MHFHSIRFKASILYSLILAVILGVFSAVIYTDIHSILYQDLDEELKVKAEEIARILYAYEQAQQNDGFSNNIILKILRGEGYKTNQEAIIDELWKSQLEVLNLKNDYIHILDIKGRNLLESNNFQGDVRELFKSQVPLSLEKTYYKNLRNETYQLRVINLPISFDSFPLVIQVGTPLYPVQHVLDEMLVFMIVAMLVFLVLTSFIGRIFAESALKPVDDVASMANKITHKDLSVRITKEQTDEEMKKLVDSFNIMIGRLDESFKHISEFSSHAAHELKTPLAIIRGEIELSLQQKRPNEEYQRVLQECLEEIDRMIRVVKDLLLLSKLDYRPDIFKFETIDLKGFLTTIFEESKMLAEPKKITVGLDIMNDNIMIDADKVHLRRLFYNIINNAIKFTPVGGRIDLSLTTDNKQCFIDIHDTGKGIAEADSKKVFNKFFRVYSEGDKTDAGTGLGLNIALSIAMAHHGDIRVKSELNKGSTFTVVLPLV